MVQLKQGTLVSLGLVSTVVQEVIIGGSVAHKMVRPRREDHIILQVVLDVVVVEWVQLVYELVTQVQVLTLFATFFSLLMLWDRIGVLIRLNC